MPGMTPRRLVLTIVTMTAAVVAIYLINPLHTPSYDPRLRLWGVTLFRNASRGMEPTIKINRIIVVSAWNYRATDPRVGDIVVFQYPPNPSIAYVKRVIATGGSTLEIRDGAVIVSGRRLSEPYLKGEPRAAEEVATMAPFRVPMGSYFMMGDNRNNSADSRVYGAVPRSNILGMVVW
jgi:signal peptidase I